VAEPDRPADRLADAGTVMRRGNDSIVFQEGDPANAVYAVVRGQIRIEVSTPSGGRLVMALKDPGDLVGEFGALDGRPRSARAVTVGDTELRQIPVDEFQSRLELDGVLAVRLLRTLSEQLRTAVDRTTARNSADTISRLAGQLITLAERFGEVADSDVPVDLELTQDDLAGWIGATREATARSLRRLREAGCVSTGRRRVTLLDLARLWEVAQ
jgi:CRP/FNR family cyclic AMP-dependent transcriptional regulator